MAVYRDRKVPIPKQSGITINRGDNNRVLYVKSAPFNAKKGYPEPKRTTIGYVCPDDTKFMYPTDKYPTIFPAAWEEAFHEKPKPIIKKMGLYTLAQAVNVKVGIIDVLENSIGRTMTNSVLDFAMYSILCHSNVAASFENRMSNQVLFSGAPYSDSYYSELFEKQLEQTAIYTFRKAWAEQCRQDGIDDVWLCIDGSNDDCESKGVELAEKGHPKSGKNVDIVSFTYAVATDGRPVTFDVYRGGLVDSKELKKIIGFLKECGIGIKGVILDRGYCNAKAIEYLDQEKIAYIIMVKGQPQGFVDTVEEYAQQIKMNVNWLIEGTYLFGVQKKCVLFDSYEKEDYITLFYDFRNANDRIEKLLKNIYNERDRLRNKIAKGEEASVADKYKAYLDVVADKDGRRVVMRKKALQEAIDSKGLYSIVSSVEMSPAEVYESYASRNSSETQYMFVKGQLGYGKVRVRFTPGVYSRFMVGFIASVIRFEIEQAAKKVDRTTNEVVNEMNLLEMTNLNGVYSYVHIENARQLEVFKLLNADEKILDETVKDENDRITGHVPTPRHRKPGPKKKGDKPKKIADGSKTSEKGKPGPKKGYKRGTVNMNGAERKKPGPKPGFKRGKFNKDGSIRKKPGPKPKEQGSDAALT